MGGLNKSILAGRLVRDPEIRYTKNQTAVSRFRLAINWRGKNGKGVDFVNCVAWARLAEVCKEYLKQGSLVAVEGRIKAESYKDKKGQNRTSTAVVIDNLQMLDFRFNKSKEEPEVKESEEELLEI